MIKHGKAGTRVHKIWTGMKQRCLNRRCKAFQNYGAKGINIQSSWHNFENFYKDMGDPPEGAMLERINNKKGYSKKNCKWATIKEQSRNKSSNVYFRFNGKKIVLTDLAKELGVNYVTLASRLKKTKSINEAIKYGIKKPYKIKLRYKGEIKTLNDWGLKLGISYKVLHRRYKNGWKVKDILNKNFTPYCLEKINFNGETLSIGGWAEKIGIKRITLQKRLSTYKWSLKKALTTKVGEANRWTK